MSIKFDYNEETKTLIVKLDDTKTEVYRIDNAKYGEIFRYMIKAIDELDGKE